MQLAGFEFLRRLVLAGPDGGRRIVAKDGVRTILQAMRVCHEEDSGDSGPTHVKMLSAGCSALHSLAVSTPERVAGLPGALELIVEIVDSIPGLNIQLKTIGKLYDTSMAKISAQLRGES